LQFGSSYEKLYRNGQHQVQEFMPDTGFGIVLPLHFIAAAGRNLIL